MGAFVLLAGPLTFFLSASAVALLSLSLAVLLISLIHDGQCLLQGLCVLRILQDLVHLQEVRFLTFGDALDANGHLLRAVLLLLLLPSAAATVASVTVTVSFLTARLLVQEAQEHGIIRVAVLDPALVHLARLPVVGRTRR